MQHPGVVPEGRAPQVKVGAQRALPLRGHALLGGVCGRRGPGGYGSRAAPRAALRRQRAGELLSFVRGRASADVRGVLVRAEHGDAAQLRRGVEFRVRAEAGSHGAAVHDAHLAPGVAAHRAADAVDQPHVGDEVECGRRFALGALLLQHSQRRLLERADERPAKEVHDDHTALVVAEDNLAVILARGGRGDLDGGVVAGAEQGVRAVGSPQTPVARVPDGHVLRLHDEEGVEVPVVARVDDGGDLLELLVVKEVELLALGADEHAGLPALPRDVAHGAEAVFGAHAGSERAARLAQDLLQRQALLEERLLLALKNLDRVQRHDVEDAERARLVRHDDVGLVLHDLDARDLCLEAREHAEHPVAHADLVVHLPDVHLAPLIHLAALDAGREERLEGPGRSQQVHAVLVRGERLEEALLAALHAPDAHGAVHGAE
mmetsp:Transcript_2876/g.8307  ORF Transcript_2876/g.8307 Transcript_2876/m.8307 type:complete len:434 (-) Transcript_2876:680-1981(-)